MYNKIFRKVLVLFTVSILVSSCSSSKIMHSWVRSEKKVNQFNTIMVLALIKDNDRFTQERMEKHLADDLHQRGFQAISALKVYGPGSFEIMSKKETFDKLRDSDVDAVMTIVLIDKTKEIVWGDVANRTSGEIYQQKMLGHYADVYHQIMDPDYYLINTEYFWESSLYDVNKNEMVYSVQTQSFNPASTESLAHEYGKLIIKDMVKKGVLK